MGNLDDETRATLEVLIKDLKKGHQSQTLWSQVASGLAFLCFVLAAVWVNDFKAAVAANGKGIAELNNRVSVIETKVDLMKKVRYKR